MRLGRYGSRGVLAGGRRGGVRLAVGAWLLVTAAMGGCRRGPEAEGERASQAEAGRLNVLLISLCSVRADHLGCYGYRRETSPELDGFAREAVLFERAVAQWPKTVPSFVSLHTGLYPHTTGVMRVTPWQRLEERFETLAEVFREAGYATAAYVSSPALNRSVNLAQGFEEYVETYRRPAAFEQTRGGAAGWLQIRGEAPFFLWVHFNNAHVPYHPPGDLKGMFVDDEYYDATRKVRINGERNDLPVDPSHPYALQILRADLGGVYPVFMLDGRRTERDYYVAEYDAAIRGADRLIGGLLGSLEELHLARRTVVVVVGDHGESLGEHNYYFEHGRLPYEPGQRVPLMIRSPRGWPAGRRVSCPVGLIDLAPTILELAGLSVREAMEGRSLVEVVENEEACGEVFFCAGYHLDFMTGVRRGRWKLIRVANELDRALMTGEEYELYDVVADAGELNNVYASQAEVAAGLRSRLAAWTAPWWSRAVETVAKRRPGGVDDETWRKLNVLGYVKEEGD